MSNRNRSRKLLLSVALAVCAASFAGMGSFATWTSTATRTHDITTGTVSITLSDGDANDAFTSTVTDFVPGDYVERLVNIDNSGSTELASITLGVAGTIVDTKALRNELAFTVKTCTQAWTGTTPGSYTCGGTESVLANAVDYDSLATYTLGSNVAAGGDVYGLVRAALPSAVSSSAFQAAATTITYTFTGTQRSGTSR